MLEALRQFIGRKIPLRLKIYHRALYNYYFGSEPELHLIRHICNQNKVAIDIGAHMGIYTYFLNTHSSACYSIEPNPELREILLQSFGRKIIILPYAMSDHGDQALLRIPIIADSQDRGRATVESGNNLEGFLCEDLSVECKRLDDLELPDVGIIKIDVEGHELAVLKGARSLLERDKPALIIESENRHRANAVHDVHSFLETLAYQCYFLHDGRLHPYSEFNANIHQNSNNVGDMGKVPGQVYVNNFIFLGNPKNYPGLRAYGISV
jgi:FkbM family methyltransferase